jgi:hypothetical protein
MTVRGDHSASAGRKWVDVTPLDAEANLPHLC